MPKRTSNKRPRKKKSKRQINPMTRRTIARANATSTRKTRA